MGKQLTWFKGEGIYPTAIMLAAVEEQIGGTVRYRSIYIKVNGFAVS